jgi:hypothetical protein
MQNDAKLSTNESLVFLRIPPIGAIFGSFINEILSRIGIINGTFKTRHSLWDILGRFPLTRRPFAVHHPCEAHICLCCVQPAARPSVARIEGHPCLPGVLRHSVKLRTRRSVVLPQVSVDCRRDDISEILHAYVLRFQSDAGACSHLSADRSRTTGNHITR